MSVAAISAAPAPIETLAEIEREHIAKALALHRGNKKAAAAALGISLNTLYNRLNEYGAAFKVSVNSPNFFEVCAVRARKRPPRPPTIFEKDGSAAVLVGECSIRANAEEVARRNAAEYTPSRQARPMAYAAINYVQAVVDEGLLPNPHRLSCVDCGKSADAYDHRDYLKPLDVVPVCTSCNILRGAGYPYTNEEGSNAR